MPIDVTKPVDESETKEPIKSDDVSSEEEEDEYEIVETDMCDDGEWVDEDEAKVLSNIF